MLFPPAIGFTMGGGGLSNLSRASRTVMEPQRVQRAYLARNPMLEKFVKETGGEEGGQHLPKVHSKGAELKANLINSDRTY